MRLYEIPAAYRAIEAQIEELEGELPEDLEAKLDELDEEFERKVEFLAMLAREAKLEAEAWKQEEDRVQARRRALEARQKRLQDYVQAAMVATGRPKVSGSKLTVAIQKNSVPTVRVDLDPTQLPPEFQRVRVEADNAAIRDAAKAGAELPDGVMVEYGSHLRIR
jgi:Skp family chaperone for outer membrane proteins